MKCWNAKGFIHGNKVVEANRHLHGMPYLSATRLSKLAPYMFMAPAAAIMAVALLWPLVYSVWLSFHDWELGTQISDAEFTGLENYRIILSDPDTLASFKTTLIFAFAVVVIEVVLGTGLALALDRPLRGMSMLRTVFILPMMIAPIVVGLVWRYLYDQQFGPLAQMFRAIGFDSPQWLTSPDWALASVIIADVWQWTPFIFILTLAALQGLPRPIMDAARVDGANHMQTIFFVKLPMILSVIVVAAVLRLIDAFKVLEVIFIMTGGGPGLSTEILSMRIYKTAFEFQQLGRASALSNLLLLMVASISIILVLLNKARQR